MSKGESGFQSILVVAFKISFLRKRKQMSLQLLPRRPSMQVQIHRDKQNCGQERETIITLRDLQLFSPCTSLAT